MMTLISLAITTAYLYSLGIFFFLPADAMGMLPGASMDFFWELATLITVMLLGHWIELRSVGQAQGHCANWQSCCLTPPSAFSHPGKPKPLR